MATVCARLRFHANAESMVPQIYTCLYIWTAIPRKKDVAGNKKKKKNKMMKHRTKKRKIKKLNEKKVFFFKDKLNKNSLT